MRSPRTYVLALVLLLALGNLWATFHRSGIPAALMGHVEEVEVRPEKHPGLDDVHLVTISGRTIHLDADVASMLRAGDEVRKAAWSADLMTPRGMKPLPVSTDFRRMAIAMPLLMLLALWLLRRTGGTASSGTLPGSTSVPRDDSADARS